MCLELKRAIIEWVFDNIGEFQIVNAAHKQFRNYIYDDTGDYLIGGKKVSEFIDETIKLVRGY